MKIVFCWSAISGYMAACWRALAARPGIEVHVLAHANARATEFHHDLMAGISHRFLDEAERSDAGLIERLVYDQKPDVVAITGWWVPAYRNLAHSRMLSGTKFVMGIDSPWRHEAQFLTRLRYHRALREFHHFVVTGERSWQYIRRLGIAPERITRGMYGVDTTHWNGVAARRQAGPWPRQFTFLGRYEHTKGIDILAAGYRAYRTTVADPWPLVCCGKGPQQAILHGEDGIIDRGFLQPSELVDVLAASGAFVMPSRFDPWPLALVEAAAAGLPIICTDACGSAVEVVRPLYNGLVIPDESPAALAQAMAHLHHAHGELPEWGRRSVELAAPYSTGMWADRWTSVIQRLMAG